ncbi:hypothetical protein ACHWQZ_G012080 [Mnemiopsis leidyi]
MWNLTILILFAHVLTAHFEQAGIAVIEQLNDLDSKFEIKFILNSNNGRVQVVSSFSLPDQITASWQIHQLPVKMGSETCSELELGSCFQCNKITNPNSNNPTETQAVCIKSTRGSQLGPSGTDLPECARIHGKDGLVGRSIVVRVRHNSPNQSDKVYCATIYDQNNLNPSFMSTIAWFDSPLTGYVAFRKENVAVSYIIVNLTRTVDNRDRQDEELKWEIRGTDISSRDSLYNPDSVPTEDAEYNGNCDPSSDTGHQSCAAGDLWKKHGRLKINNGLQINLMMFVDNNLASAETLSQGQNLVILNTTNKANGTIEQIVAWSKIESLEPVSTNIPFMDGSSLLLLQRDDWSPVGQSYQSAHQNTPGKWEVSIYGLPPLQIFGGDQWDCDEIKTKGWSYSSSKMLDLPPFKTSREVRYLNQTYTLYGRNSMMYRGVAIRPENDAKYKCATITYKQGEEKISYSLLEPTDKDMMDQRMIVILIEHEVVRQTTVLMATLCGSNEFLLELTESPGCIEDTRDIYNPFGVCPAYCPLGGSCKRMCPPLNLSDGELYENCCTMCDYDSSFLCPVGDLHRRLDVFQQCSRNHYTNRETVFSVKNEVNLPLTQMNNKFIGVHVFARDASHRVLMRCGVVKELTETVVVLKDIGGGNVTLSQKAAWQPITVTFQGIEVVSLKIWDSSNRNSHHCYASNKDNRPFYQEDFRGDRSGDTFVRKSITLENKDKIPTFFGKESIIEKSLELSYRTRDGRSETTTVESIRPKWASNDTYRLQAVLNKEQQRVLKFNFEQRRGHLAADTYVKVEVLSKKYCNKTIKWYLVSNNSVENFQPGDVFELSGYDGMTLKGAHNVQQSCNRSPSQYPYNLDMGDLSGILGDVKLDGPTRVFVHESLPLLEVEGHYLLIADDNNSVIATIKLETPPDPDNVTVTQEQGTSSKKTTFIIIAVVSVGVFVVVLISVVGSLLMYRICLKKTSDRDAGYQHLSQSAQRPPPHGHMKLYRNRRTGALCYLHPDGNQFYKLKVQDAKTGVVSYVHYGELEQVNPDEQHLGRYGESNGSTNGSSLTRSRNTVAEENLYTTVSPTAGHPNNMGSLMASPESSSSSLSSHS